jgi:uncharacterized membrane protein YedE/YeeE
MIDAILKPWPWYVSGPLIASVMFFLIFSGRNFGMSGNLRTLCAAFGGNKACDFFKFDWKAQRWNLIFSVGAILGGYIAINFLSSHAAVDISENTIEWLKQYGFNDGGKAYLPEQLFSIEALSNPKSLGLIVLGGFLVGFGSRYAGGCTSGHAISGLSDLQLPSLIAVIGFFAGGLVMVHFIYPLLFS